MHMWLKQHESVVNLSTSSIIRERPTVCPNGASRLGKCARADAACWRSCGIRKDARKEGATDNPRCCPSSKAANEYYDYYYYYLLLLIHLLQNHLLKSTGDNSHSLSDACVAQAQGVSGYMVDVNLSLNLLWEFKVPDALRRRSIFELSTKGDLRLLRSPFIGNTFWLCFLYCLTSILSKMVGFFC